MPCLKCGIECEEHYVGYKLSAGKPAAPETGWFGTKTITYPINGIEQVLFQMCENCRIRNKRKTVLVSLSLAVGLASFVLVIVWGIANLEGGGGRLGFALAILAFGFAAGSLGAMVNAVRFIRRETAVYALAGELANLSSPRVVKKLMAGKPVSRNVNDQW